MARGAPYQPYVLVLAALLGVSIPGQVITGVTPTDDRSDSLTIARHAAVAFSNATADTQLRVSTSRLRIKNRATDCACCVALTRSGDVGTFGTAGDGLDVITSQEELRSVLAVATHRVKVVTAMNGNMCGGNGPLLGCAFTPGTSLAITADAPAIAWAHEFGHNQGLHHRTDSDRLVMYPTGYSYLDEVDAAECTAFREGFSEGTVLATPCVLPCGDSVVDSGEECDAGTLNGTVGSCCSASCRLRGAGETCRPAAGECDPQETCTGSDPACPADVVAARGTPCADDGDTTTFDVCGGVSPACLHPVNPSAFIGPHLCYKTRVTRGTPRFAPVAGLRLADQFQSGAVDVKKPVALCSAADEDGGSAQDPSAYQQAFLITPPKGSPPLRVRHRLTVVDPFGTLEIDATGPDRLLVPTIGLRGGPLTAVARTAGDEPRLAAVPTAADQYTCYRVKPSIGGPAFGKPRQTRIADQFGARLYEVKKPTRLCTPAGDEINHPAVHLMCYRVRAARGQPGPSKVALQIRAQSRFGLLQLDALAPEELCVPATGL
jgi:hypothetical protein